MSNKLIRNELIKLLPMVLLLDLTLYAISVIFIGISYSMALGLLLGTAVLLINLYLLANSSERALLRYKTTNSEKSAKRAMFQGYLLRYLVVGLALYVSVSVKFGFLFNTIGVIVPMVYPKLIYFIQGLTNKKGKED